jgi:GTP-binding protein
MRSSTADMTEMLTPPTTLSLEQALEFIRQDECLEVTPAAVRPRKVELASHARARQRSRARE